MRVENKITTALILLAGAVLAESAYLAVRHENAVDAVEYVACAAGEEEEAAEVPRIALTFDDGPDPRYTEQLLDGLKERGAKASFFVMGKQAEAYPELIIRMQEEGD